MPLAGGRARREKCFGNAQISVEDPGALNGPIHLVYGDEIGGGR